MVAVAMAVVELSTSSACGSFTLEKEEVFFEGHHPHYEVGHLVSAVKRVSSAAQ